MTISPSSPSKVPRPKSPSFRSVQEESEPEYTPSTRAVEVEIWYMRRGEESRYSLSAAPTRLSSEVLRSTERSRATDSRSDDIFTASSPICPFPIRVRPLSGNEAVDPVPTAPPCHSASHSGDCGYRLKLCLVFRLVVLRRHTGAGGVELQFANGDSGAICPEISEAEDAA